MKKLTFERELELIRCWDYVDCAEHCIDLTTMKVRLCHRREIERNPNLESIEFLEGGLEYVYGLKK